MDVFGQIYFRFGFESILSVLTSQPTIFGLIIVGFTIHWLPTSFKENYRGAFIKSSITMKIVATLIVTFIIFQFKTSEIQPFIYFRF
jgi:alginate O-acetyltransferase complex protein AlgI